MALRIEDRNTPFEIKADKDGRPSGFLTKGANGDLYLYTNRPFIKVVNESGSEMRNKNTGEYRVITFDNGSATTFDYTNKAENGKWAFVEKNVRNFQNQIYFGKDIHETTFSFLLENNANYRRTFKTRSVFGEFDGLKSIDITIALPNGNDSVFSFGDSERIDTLVISSGSNIRKIAATRGRNGLLNALIANDNRLEAKYTYRNKDGVFDEDNFSVRNSTLATSDTIVNTSFPCLLSVDYSYLEGDGNVQVDHRQIYIEMHDEDTAGSGIWLWIILGLLIIGGIGFYYYRRYQLKKAGIIPETDAEKVARLQKEVSTHIATISNLQNTEKNLLADKNDLQNEVKKLIADLENSQNEVKKGIAVSENLQDSLEKTKTHSEKLQSLLDNANHRIAVFEEGKEHEENIALHKQIEELHAEYAEKLRMTIEQKDKECADAISEIKTSTDKIVAETKANAEASITTTNINADAIITKTVSDANAAMAETKADAEAKIKALTEKYETELSAIKQLNNEKVASLTNKYETQLAETKSNAEAIVTKTKADAAAAISETNTNAEKAISETNADAEKMVAEANAKANAIIAEIKANAEKEISDTKVNAEREISSTKADAEKMISDTKANAEREISDTKANAEREISEIKKEADRIVSEARETAKKEIDEIRATAEREVAEEKEKTRQANEIITSTGDNYIKFLKTSVDKIFEQITVLQNEISLSPLDNNHKNVINHLSLKFTGFRQWFEKSIVSAQAENKWGAKDIEEAMIREILPLMTNNYSWLSELVRFYAYTSINRQFTEEFRKSYVPVDYVKSSYAEACTLLGKLGITLYLPHLFVDDFNNELHKINNTPLINSYYPQGFIEYKAENRGMIYDLLRPGYSLNGEMKQLPEVCVF